MRATLLVIALTLPLPFPAAAQDRLDAVAFVVAPEQAYGECRAATPEAAAACAIKQCEDGGAAKEDCALVKSCYQAGWSGRVGVQHKEGPHWPEYFCGWDSKEAVESAMAIACDMTRRNYLTFCEVTQVWDEDGNALMSED